MENSSTPKVGSSVRVAATGTLTVRLPRSSVSDAAFRATVGAMRASPSRRIERRHFLGLAGLSLAAPRLITSCGGSPDVSRKQSAPPYTEFDPSQPWWLQGNYAPVEGEFESTTLEVVGSLPKELTGLYVRNGSNSETEHWFMGQGMVHGVRLEGGSAKWYRRRWVQTPLIGAEPSAGPPTLTDNASNVALIHHGGRLLSLGEIGLPYELDAKELSTVGVYDYDGALATAMTAHPKLDPRTGELLMFGYGLFAPLLTFHQVAPDGKLARSEVIDVPAAVMMHDFAISEKHVIFMDLPIIFDLQLAIDGAGLPFRWDAGHGARMGVMPRDGGNADVKWFTIDDCYVFHVMNAYEDPKDPNVVVLEAVRHPKLWDTGPQEFDSSPSLSRWRFDLASGASTEEKLDDGLIEFPQFNRSLLGRPYRYGYALDLHRYQAEGVPGAATGVFKYDHQSGERRTIALEAGLQPDEAIFVPAEGGSSEDDGWLLTYAYDHRTQKTDLLVLDAKGFSSKPVARVKLPVRVPFGFHGLWIPG